MLGPAVAPDVQEHDPPRWVFTECSRIRSAASADTCSQRDRRGPANRSGPLSGNSRKITENIPGIGNGLLYIRRRPSHRQSQLFKPTVKVRPLRTHFYGSLIQSHRLMSNGVPLTPRSRRRQSSRLDRELDESERRRRAPVSDLTFWFNAGPF